MRRLWPTALTAIFAAGCRMGADVAPSPASATAPSGADFGLRLAKPSPQEWLGTGRDYAEQRFGPLAQIDRGNVA